MKRNWRERESAVVAGIIGSKDDDDDNGARQQRVYNFLLLP